MAEYTIKAPDGRTVKIRGETPPSKEALDKIFASLPSVVPKKQEPVIAVAEAGEDPARGRMLEGGLLGEVGISPTATSEPLRGGGVVADMGLEGGGATAGQVVGAMTGPFAPVAIPVLGSLGGSIGNYAAQKRRIAEGEQGKINVGELIGSALTSALPGGPAGASGGRALVREGGKQAAGALTAKNIQTLIDEGRLANPTEGALALAVPFAGGTVAQKIQGDIPASVVTRSVKGNSLAEMQELGGVVPVSDVNPSWLNKRLESIAGPADVRRAAQVKNQKVANEAVVEELGLPKGTEITMPVLRDLRKQASAPYEEISNISPDAKKALGELRDARNNASLEFAAYARNATPDSLRAAQKSTADAEALEAALEGIASAAGRNDLIDAMRAARTRIAKSYDVERALNLGDANVSLPALGRAVDKGRPLSGNLEILGNFAESFPRAVAEGAKVQPFGLSKTEAITGGALGTTAMMASGNPVLAGALAIAPPALSSSARRLVLSQPYQRAMANLPGEAARATPDEIAAAIRLLAQAAGSNDEAAKLFTSPGSMAPSK